MNISEVSNTAMQVTRIQTPVVASNQESEKPESVSPTESIKAVQEAQVAESADKEAKQVSEEQLHQVVDRMNDFVQSSQRDLSFSIDDETGHDVVRVIDTSTEEVVRQMPSEEFLDISKSMNSLSGVLFKDQV
jgi:flagellar protein FlaG